MAREFIATFGLIATILGCVRFRPEAIPAAVGLYIGSAYWFTSSTSFANPAVTIARALSDTFSGIAPGDVPGFLLAEFAGALAAAWLFGWLLAEPQRRDPLSRPIGPSSSLCRLRSDSTNRRCR